ncbi:MAG: glutaredoxin domain-containing protein [Limisphaerales bacterium]
MKTRLFIKPYCGWCDKAARWLDDHDIAYERIDVIADDAAFCRDGPSFWPGTRTGAGRRWARCWRILDQRNFQNSLNC